MLVVRCDFDRDEMEVTEAEPGSLTFSECADLAVTDLIVHSIADRSLSHGEPDTRAVRRLRQRAAQSDTGGGLLAAVRAQSL
ncbi:hypothetical protein FJT64_019501 [Amphibalanus amphitrite]|uniref:Uncharacterized protein n=1 Tax=Amphibalanus amphitrite TaxID=1232801 RepID=A0A6A4X365_AMPAM|nr:hypothetical protein FJT64_019501 [Amphibalanus amphitrite]